MRLAKAAALLAFAFPSALYHLLPTLQAVAVITALVYVARHWPKHSHPIAAKIIGHRAATTLTGHKTPAPAPQPKHAPATGPQIPVSH